MQRPRVLFADDHRLLVEACIKLLEPECDVVGNVGDGRTLLLAVRTLRPDVVVLDIGMPLLNGLDAGRQLKTMMPTVKLVFLTMNEDPDLAAEAFRIGASGYLLKSSAASELSDAIRTAMEGKVYVGSEAVGGTSEGRGKTRHRSTPNRLTLRQREVLQLLVEGYSMKEAANILDVTPRTVAFHKYRIMEQFQVKSNAELYHFALKQSVVPSSPRRR